MQNPTKPHAHMNKLSRRTQRLYVERVIIVLVSCLFGLLLASAAYMYVQGKQTLRTISLTETTPTPADTRSFFTKAFEDNAPFSLLILGYGGAGHDGAYLTDTMISAYVDPAHQAITLISIPRDTWIPLDIGTSTPLEKKINEAYSIGRDDKEYPLKKPAYQGEIGGGTMAKDAVKYVTGIQQDRFISLDFSTFKRIIDIVGGITITVTRPFEDRQYPIDGQENNLCGHTEEELSDIKKAIATDEALMVDIFPCRYEDLVFNRGTQTMDGSTALKYVRSRHSATEGNDFARSSRQKEVLFSLREKALSPLFLPKIPKVLDEVSRGLKTDLTPVEIQELLGKAGILKGYTLHTVALTDKNAFRSGVAKTGQYILVPASGEARWDSVHAYVQTELTKLLPTPTLAQ